MPARTRREIGLEMAGQRSARSLLEAGRRRLPGKGPPALELVVLALFIIVAVRAEAYHRPNPHLHDAGVWVTSGSQGAVGRVNTEIQLVDTRIDAPDGLPNFDVLQSGAAVLFYDQTNAKLLPIDPALASLGHAEVLAPQAVVGLGGNTVSVLDAGPQQLSVT